MVKGNRKSKIKVIAVLVGIIALMVLIMIFVGKPIINFVSQKDTFRDWVQSHGIVSRLAFLGMTMLQVVVAVIPGEPLELVAGYAFGTIEGTLLCMVGATLGGVPIFLLVKKYGIKAVEVFFPKEKVESLKFLKSSPKRDFLIFILFFLPGTPKDLLNYIVGLTDMRLSRWLFISFFARIPSIITSTISGNALQGRKYLFAIIVYGVTFAVSAVGILVYNKIVKKHSENDTDIA